MTVRGGQPVPLSPTNAPARRGRWRLAGALLASLAVHALALWLGNAPSGHPSPRAPQPAPLQLRLAEAGSPHSTARPSLPTPPPAATPTPSMAPGNDAPPPPFDPDRYLPLAALDLKPLVQREPTALLPNDAAPEQSGTLTLEIFLNASGGIDRIEVISTTPPDLPTSWRNAAVSGFAGATFSPGWKDGQAVPSRLRLEISHHPAP